MFYSIRADSGALPRDSFEQAFEAFFAQGQ